MKQTAVEWLDKQIENISIQVFDGFLTFIEFMEEREKLFNQAKELEKQQIINFTNDFINKHTFGDYDGIVQKNKSVEEYYNEKFNKKEPDCKDKCCKYYGKSNA